VMKPLIDEELKLSLDARGFTQEVVRKLQENGIYALLGSETKVVLAQKPYMNSKVPEPCTRKLRFGSLIITRCFRAIRKNTLSVQT